MRSCPVAVWSLSFLLLVVGSAPPQAVVDEISATTGTFSIVGYDPATGDMGVAVHSKYFAVGAVVPWGDPGVGVIATQAAVNTGYGPKGLELLREGLSAQQAAERLLEEDTFPRLAGRQFAIVDADGNVAVHTGPEASEWAGHVKGEHHSAQGNILAGPAVVQEMSRAFEATDGELAEKLMAALEAGQAAGGDRRGVQSAAMLVIREEGGRGYDNDFYIRLHVEDHETPIQELRRLLNMQLAMGALDVSRQRLADDDLEASLAAATRASELAPQLPEAHLTLGFLHYLRGDREAALASMRRARSLHDPFRELFDSYTRFVPRFRVVADDEEFMSEIFD